MQKENHNLEEEIKLAVHNILKMVARITKKNLHHATDWGDATGKEVW